MYRDFTYVYRQVPMNVPLYVRPSPVYPPVVCPSGLGGGGGLQRASDGYMSVLKGIPITVV